MPLIRINGFGDAGVETDPQPSLLAPGTWTWLENIDIESGDIRSAWGEHLISAGPPVVPRYMYVFEGAEDTWLIISDGSKIYSFDGSVWVDISPVTGDVHDVTWEEDPALGDGTWDGGTVAWDETLSADDVLSPVGGFVSFDVFLGTLIMCSSSGVPSYWPDTAERMQPLPGWNASWRAQTIVSFGNFLVAIGLNDGTVEGSKYRIAWSDAAAEGTVPQEWGASATNLAGSLQLRDTSGYLTTAKILKNDLIIYKNDSIYRMFQREDAFVMGVERVIDDHGCDSPRGVDAVAGVHFFADRGDIRVFDGQSTNSVAARRIKESLTAGISNAYRDATICVAFPERDELWVGVVPVGGEGISSVLVYNTIHDAWTLKIYPGALAMVLGPFSGTIVPEDETWDNGQMMWDAWVGTWNDSTFEPSEDSVLFGTSSRIYVADKSDTDSADNAKSVRAEKTGFMLDLPSPNVTVKRVYPEMEGSATINLSVGFQWKTNGPIAWSTPKPFTPGVDGGVPVRVTGKPVGFRVTSMDINGWRLGAVSFDIVPASGR